MNTKVSLESTWDDILKSCIEMKLPLIDGFINTNNEPYEVICNYNDSRSLFNFNKRSCRTIEWHKA